MRETFQWTAWLLVCVVGFGLFAYCLIDNEAQRKLDEFKQKAMVAGDEARAGQGRLVPLWKVEDEACQAVRPARRTS